MTAKLLVDRICVVLSLITGMFSGYYHSLRLKNIYFFSNNSSDPGTSAALFKDSYSAIEELSPFGCYQCPGPGMAGRVPEVSISTKKWKFAVDICQIWLQLCLGQRKKNQTTNPECPAQPHGWSLLWNSVKRYRRVCLLWLRTFLKNKFRIQPNFLFWRNCTAERVMQDDSAHLNQQQS